MGDRSGGGARGKFHVQPGTPDRAPPRRHGAKASDRRPYDAELFGHWWFEGPEWIDFSFGKAPTIRTFSASPHRPSIFARIRGIRWRPRRCAVGDGRDTTRSGWRSNDWIYRHLHQAADRMVSLARRFPKRTAFRNERCAKPPASSSWRRLRTGLLS